MKTRILFPILLIFSFLSYAQREVETLVDYMVGSFSSKEQSEIDSNYFNIELEMIQIWKDRTDGPWLYIEQAIAESKDKPYRQRVYQLRKRADGKIESLVYTIPDPLRFAGDFKKEFPLLRLTPDSLILKEGCEVVLFQTDEGHFEGSTIDRNCPSDLRGASYATSKVIIYKDKMISWDRGFDENGNQVWGATTGGYIFKKKFNKLQKKY
ncbi:MAG: chromophore lyase CpcT/CpeT [Ignavibacteriaceae bacterium]|nr:chromophore lyase CpcT/CpeT [Ignavibacteriaceae bacterium]